MKFICSAAVAAALVAFCTAYSARVWAEERFFGPYYCSGCRGPLPTIPGGDLRNILVDVWLEHNVRVRDVVKVCGPVDCVKYTFTDDGKWSDGKRTPFYPMPSGGGSETSPNPANPHPGGPGSVGGVGGGRMICGRVNGRPAGCVFVMG